jgi:hypothetical protein
MKIKNIFNQHEYNYYSKEDRDWSFLHDLFYTMYVRQDLCLFDDIDKTELREFMARNNLFGCSAKQIVTLYKLEKGE